MNCKDAQTLLAAHSDGELGLPHATDLESHLEGCAACRGSLAGMTELRASLRSNAQYHAMPQGLEARLLAALPQSGTAALAAGPVTRVRARRNWAWPQIGAAFAMCFALAWSITLYVALPGPAERLQDELVAGHTRALMTGHAVDIVSSDRHTVKPWFNGKLDFSPAVFDLSAQGFVLAGGRLDYLGGRPVAALVYQHKAHPINVFVWPAAGRETGRDDAPRSATRLGYNLLHWTRAGLNYWAVSDLNAGELAQFRDMLLQAAD